MKEKGIQHILFVQNHDSSTTSLSISQAKLSERPQMFRVGQEVKWSALVLPDIILIET